VAWMLDENLRQHSAQPGQLGLHIIVVNRQDMVDQVSRGAVGRSLARSGARARLGDRPASSAAVRIFRSTSASSMPLSRQASQQALRRGDYPPQQYSMSS
jgi:hypothetical protein